MRRFLFIGERPSRTACSMGVSWRDGRLAAKTLFAALRACGVEPLDQLYLNWFQTRWDCYRPRRGVVALVQTAGRGRRVVALGRRVAQALTYHNIPHLHLTHPAARGLIRRTTLYQEHVRSVLLACEES